MSKLHGRQARKNSDGLAETCTDDDCPNFIDPGAEHPANYRKAFAQTSLCPKPPCTAFPDCGCCVARRESHCSYCGSEYWRCHTMEQAKHCNPSPKRQKAGRRVLDDDPSPYDWEDEMTEPEAVRAAVLANRRRNS